MSKQSIVEKHSKKIIGILNVGSMTIEVNEKVQNLKELFAKFDGEEVTLSLNKNEEIG